MIIQLLKAAWLPGLIGSILFTGFLLIHHFYGPGPNTRDENGKRKFPKEFRTFVAVEFTGLIVMMLSLATFSVSQFQNAVPEAGAIMQISAAYVVLWIINLWDLIVIDWVLVVRFRPKQIVLPDTPYFTTMKPHVFGWFGGNVYIVPFAVVAYLLTHLF